MYPHERSLVKKLEGKPFALIGVNSDSDRSALKKAMQEENITWRSFFDGGKIGGPIATRWAVQGWPTLYVIDHKGVIRHKHVGSPGDKKLDEEIETLIKEAEGKK
jgi:peroxiredoxin